MGLCVSTPHDRDNTVQERPPTPTRLYDFTQSLTGVKHLVCDDSSYNRLVLEKYLQQLQVDVEHVSSGEECLEIVRAAPRQYDIVWMDVRMEAGCMDGIECARRLVSETAFNGVIIALTGFTDEKTQNACRAAGMKHFVRKPWSRTTMREYTYRYARHQRPGALNGPITLSIGSI